MNVNEIATKQDIKELKQAITQLGNKIVSSEINKPYTINELANLNIIGKYTRLKTLISKGLLKTLPDGRISKEEVNNYLAIIKKK